MRRLAPLALIVLATAGCVAHQDAGAPPSASTPRIVHTAVAKASRVAQAVELTGAISARHVAVVAAQQAGRVDSLGVREGDAVTAGETIGSVDAETYAAGALSASGTADAARAATQASRADIAAADAALSVAQSANEAAAATARNAATHARRIESLYAQGAVSREFRDDAVTAADRAQAELSSSEASIAQARSAAVGARAHAAMAAGQSIAAQGEAQQAAASLGQTAIVAPFDGIVTKRWLDTGAYANPGTPIVTIESSGQLEADISVPEEDAAAVVPGARVDLRVDALGGRPIPARVRALIPTAADNSHQYVATLDVPYSRALLPGMFVRARVAAHAIAGVGVPASAVTTRAGQPGVFVLDGGRAEFQPVTIAASDGKTTILSGIAIGAIVAVGPSLPDDGDAVATAPATTAMSR